MSKQNTKVVRLAYGKTGLQVEVPAEATVIEPQYVPGLPDEPAGIAAALRDPIGSLPLREIAKPGQKAAIVHTDITRATPNDRLLPVILRELEAAGIRRSDIVLINALGTHRKQTEAELKTMLGAEVVANYRCLQHDGHDDANLVELGTSRFGHKIRANRQFVEADVRMLTGFIEPHFFAGFSGGPKGVLPSIAGAESVLDNHGAKMVGHPKATWGITEGNPLWEEMLDAAELAKPSFIVNVTLNTDRQITGVFAGGLRPAHARGCEFVKRHAMATVPSRFDLVVTSNSGYPLDLNLYQTVKGISAASQIVREGGVIIAAAECWDGIPDFGNFGKLLSEFRTPAEAVARIESDGPGWAEQWQVQVLARIRLRSDVYVHASGLTPEQLRKCLVEPCPRIEDTIRELVASGRVRRDSICVMPEGPLTIPYIA